jgi:hypothetical protein
MSPENTRVWRKTRRQVLRGTPAGRRATHAVQTTYGRHQRDAERRARWAATRAAELEVVTRWMACDRMKGHRPHAEVAP